MHVHDLAVTRNPFATKTISSESFAEFPLPRSNGIDESGQPLRNDLVLANRDAQLALLLNAQKHTSENEKPSAGELFENDWVAAGKSISQVDQHYYQTGW